MPCLLLLQAHLGASYSSSGATTEPALLSYVCMLQLTELVRQLRQSTHDLSSTETLAAASYIPDAPTQKLLVLESMRAEAGPQNIAGAGRALLAVAYGTRRDSVLNRASSTAKYQQQILDCSPYTADTQVVALELNCRVLAFSLKHTADVMDYPRLEEDYEAYGAHCTGQAFAGFLWRYQQLLQHDLYLLGYDVAFEKGVKTSEEKRSGVFWVTISYTSDVHPPSPNCKHQTVSQILQHDLSGVRV